MHPSRANANSGCVIAFTRWFILLMCAGLGTGGGFAFWHGLEQRRLNHEATQWPEASGRVLRGWVKTVEVRTGHSSTSHYSNPLHEVMVDFTFPAEGQTYNATGSAPRQIGEEDGKIVAQSIADSYAPGASITVFFQPGNPKENRLRRVEVDSSVWLWFAIIGGLTVPAALWSMWWMWFRYERPRANRISTTLRA